MRSRSHKCPGDCHSLPFSLARLFSNFSIWSAFAHTGLASQYSHFAFEKALFFSRFHVLSMYIPGCHFPPSSQTFFLFLCLVCRRGFLAGGGVGGSSSSLSESESPLNVTALVVLRRFFGEVVAMAWTKAVSCAMSCRSCLVSLLACVAISLRRVFMASACSWSRWWRAAAAASVVALCAFNMPAISTAAFADSRLFAPPLAASYASRLATFLLKKDTA